MKRLCVALLILTMLVSLCPAGLAASDINVTISGVPVTWTDARPFIDSNNRTLVPLRAVADAIGLTVSWDKASRSATFSFGLSYMTFPVGSRYARYGGGEHGSGTVEMDTAATIVDGRTYAPVRYLAEYFGYHVGWDKRTKTVTLTPGGWMRPEAVAYSDFLSKHDYLTDIKDWYAANGEYGPDEVYSTRFMLADLDADDVLELFVAVDVHWVVDLLFVYTYRTDTDKVQELFRDHGNGSVYVNTRTGLYYTREGWTVTTWDTYNLADRRNSRKLAELQCEYDDPAGNGSYVEAKWWLDRKEVSKQSYHAKLDEIDRKYDIAGCVKLEPLVYGTSVTHDSLQQLMFEPERFIAAK